MKSVKHLLILLCLCLYAGVSQAQVTIGDNSLPNSFSVLELISNQERGLRLPQLTTGQRSELKLDEITDVAIKEAAKGLMIFNTTTNCVETWNGTIWISSCANVACQQATTITIKANTSTTQTKTGTFVFELVTNSGASISSLVVDWYVNDILASTTEGTRFFAYRPGEVGSYSVRATVKKSCLVTSALPSNTITVTVQ